MDFENMFQGARQVFATLAIMGASCMGANAQEKTVQRPIQKGTTYKTDAGEVKISSASASDTIAHKMAARTKTTAETSYYTPLDLRDLIENDIYMVYDENKNMFRFYEQEPWKPARLTGEAEMSDYYRRHRGNPDDPYAKAERYEAAAAYPGLSKERRNALNSAALGMHSRYRVGVTRGNNLFYSSKYYSGPYTEYRATIGVGGPSVGKNIFLETSCTFFNKDPDRLRYLGHNSKEIMPGHLFFGIHVETNPDSKIIAGFRAGGTGSFAIGNIQPNLMNLKAEFILGARFLTRNGIHLELTANAGGTTINPIYPTRRIGKPGEFLNMVGVGVNVTAPLGTGSENKQSRPWPQ